MASSFGVPPKLAKARVSPCAMQLIVALAPPERSKETCIELARTPTFMK
jgi:hypothetical protein